ncbi:S8 family serine peptidase [candidate division GN15 bacterium]|nr:S8 family serine peptidase [candidate division GN15 bacterium]
MHRKTPLIGAILTLMVLVFILAAPAAHTASDAVPNQAIVALNGRIPADIIARNYGAVVIDSIPQVGAYLLALPEKGDSDSLIQRLCENPAVDTSVENQIWRLPETDQISQGFPDENVQPFLRGESPPSYYEQAATYDIGLDSALLLADGSGITVAVIDNGIVRDHPLVLASSIATGYDFVDDDSDPIEEAGTMYGHGTFVTGVVLLTAPECRILPMRAFNAEGEGQLFDIMQAIISAKLQGAQVINMSFSTTQLSPTLNAALNSGGANQSLMVASAGNDSAQITTYPAAHNLVMGISAINEGEYVADFSNYGEYIELCAPGVDVYSALPGAESGWGTWSGTSFSTPFVAGVAALALSKDPDRSLQSVRQLMTDAARIELAGGTIVAPDIYYGWGLIDAWETVASLSIGDLDGSGERDSTDLQLMSDFVNGNQNGGWGPPTAGLSNRLADINCDGTVSILDLSAMARLLSNGRWDKVLPCVRP